MIRFDKASSVDVYNRMNTPIRQDVRSSSLVDSLRRKEQVYYHEMRCEMKSLSQSRKSCSMRAINVADEVQDYVSSYSSSSVCNYGQLSIRDRYSSTQDISNIGRNYCAASMPPPSFSSSTGFSLPLCTNVYRTRKVVRSRTAAGTDHSRSMSRFTGQFISPDRQSFIIQNTDVLHVKGRDSIGRSSSCHASTTREWSSVRFMVASDMCDITQGMLGSDSSSHLDGFCSCMDINHGVQKGGYFTCTCEQGCFDCLPCGLHM